MDGINKTSLYKESNICSENGDEDCNDDEDDVQETDGTTTEAELVERRDEVGEVRKMSSKDTHRLRLWRIVVTGVLLLTAFAVTFSTYTLLKHQEDENFQIAVCGAAGHLARCIDTTTFFMNRMFAGSHHRLTSLIFNSLHNLLVPLVMPRWINNDVRGKHLLALPITYHPRPEMSMRHGQSFEWLTLNYTPDKFDCKVELKFSVVGTWSNPRMPKNI